MTDLKRLNLALPRSLYESVEMIAARKGITITETIRRLLKLGIFIDARDWGGEEIYFKAPDDSERKIELIW